MANRDFLLDVLLVCVTGQASSSSRLSNWMGVASSTFSVVKAFAVCVGVWGAQVVVVVNQLRLFLEKAVSCSALSVWPAHSPPWLWWALLISCTCSGTISLEVSFPSTLSTETLLLWFGGVSLLGLLEI